MTVLAQDTQAKTTVGKVIELTAESPVSFEDAVSRGIAKASETIDHIRGAWVEGQQVSVHGGRITGYRVDLKVTFVVH